MLSKSVNLLLGYGKSSLLQDVHWTLVIGEFVYYAEFSG